MTPPPSGGDRVAVEPAETRGEIRTGFAGLNGRLGLALQRTEATESDIDALQDRVTALEGGRRSLPAVVSVSRGGDRPRRALAAARVSGFPLRLLSGYGACPDSEEAARPGSQPRCLFAYVGVSSAV
ncbi:hypothetical protein ACIQZB_44495 [Streptomyces sp. NPDC097727]|uniref:hypothetical protein n=1 Tax=Streptomyces sp. NPDC097727 TaxID=3366092 RepID=UPI00381B9C96